MKKQFRKLPVLILIVVLALANPGSVLADEGDGEHGLAVEVNGYHVTLSNQNEWMKGGNIVVVTITDAMGMPVSNVDVEMLITPKVDSHSDSDLDSHGGTETSDHAQPAADNHESESSHDSMSAMDDHSEESPDVMAHGEETATPMVMTESHEHGEYTAEAHLKKSGEHVVQVFFHINGEMMQADFIVDVAGTASKTVVLWSFLLINVGLVVSAGVLKNQTVAGKGK